MHYFLACNTGKEYVCVLRLHDAISGEVQLAQVTNIGSFCVYKIYHDILLITCRD